MTEKRNLYFGNNNEIDFKDVCFSWPSDKRKIINNCSFSIRKPGLSMIVGKNGCGKSTLFKLIQGVLHPTSGYIDRPSNISMVFQNPDHQILMPTCRSELIINIKKNMSRKDINLKVAKAFNKVGLTGFDKRPIQTLSGGQKQRLAIASALISDSNFILLDEPTSLLDELSQKQILEIIRSLTSYKNDPLTALWITHRMDELDYADQVATMKNGKLSKWQNPSNFKKG